MLYQEDGHAARAAELEERAAVKLDLVRKELRRRIVAKGLRFTKLSRDLGHSSTYLSSVLSAAPRTDLRLKTVLILLELLDVSPGAFFEEALALRRQELDSDTRQLLEALEARDAEPPRRVQPSVDDSFVPSRDDLAWVVGEALKSLSRLKPTPEERDKAKAS